MHKVLKMGNGGRGGGRQYQCGLLFPSLSVSFISPDTLESKVPVCLCILNYPKRDIWFLSWYSMRKDSKNVL